MGRPGAEHCFGHPVIPGIHPKEEEEEEKKKEEKNEEEGHACPKHTWAGELSQHADECSAHTLKAQQGFHS